MSEPVTPVATADAAARSSTIAAKKTWRDHIAQSDTTKPAIRIGLSASFTADTLVPFFGAALLAEGTAPEFKVGPYNQLFQTCLDPQGTFPGPCDVIVLLWRLEDLMLTEITGFLAG